MLPVCVKRSRLYCSTIIFCNLIFKSASKLQLCPLSCLHGAWNACILWLKRDCSGQSHVIRQVVPPTLSIIKAIPPSSGTWYKVFTADRSFVYNAYIRGSIWQSTGFPLYGKQFKCRFFFMITRGHEMISRKEVEIHNILSVLNLALFCNHKILITVFSLSQLFK